MIHFQPLAAPPVVAAPWKIYRTSIKRSKRTIRQLRIEIKNPGDKGDPALSRLLIGTRDAAGDFNARLTMSADCTVTINGNVQVSGDLSEGPIMATATDPRFTALIANQWAKGTVIGQVTAAPGTLQVTVRDTKTAVVPGATVNIENLATSFKSTGRTGADGNFTASGLAAGKYNIRIAAAGFNPATINDVEVGAGATVPVPVTLTVPVASSGTIQGSVLDNAGGIVTNASLDLLNLSTKVRKRTTTSDQGAFRFTNLEAGNYQITASATGFEPTTVTVSPGQTVNITLTMQTPTGTIQGTVTDPDGAIKDATVEVKNVGANFTRTAVTLADGLFTFPNVPIGTCSVRITNRASTPQVIDLRAGQTLDLTLMPD